MGVGTGVGVVTGVPPPVVGVDDINDDEFAPAPAPQPVIPPTASSTANRVLFGLVQKRKRASWPGTGREAQVRGSTYVS